MRIAHVLRVPIGTRLVLMTVLADRRLLLVHAHPDDESIGSGITMAKYVEEGAHVTLVTCTLGEEGEVLIEELAHIAADQDDILAEYRLKELEAAMEFLGVRDHRRLGGDGKYRDTGMSWGGNGQADLPDESHATAFWHADFLAAATDLVAVIREVKPQVVVTYDEFGGYGHPDHIQANRVTHYAVALAAAESFRRDLGPAWDVAKVYWTTSSATRLRLAMETLEGGENMLPAFDPNNLPPMFTEDENIAASIVGTEAQTKAKIAAMQAHETQIRPDGHFFAMGMDLALLTWSTEHFRLAKGTKGPVGESGFEEDLFSGIA